MIAAADFRFQPHEDRGSIRAFVLAVVMHCLLIAFLYFGISWTNQPAAPAQADLWTALPPMTSTPPPRAVTPPPPPPKPEPKPEPKVVEPEPVPPPPVKADIVQKTEKKKVEKKEPPPKKKEEEKKPPPPKEVKKEPPPPPPKKDPPKVQPKPVDDITAALEKESREKAMKDINAAASRDLAGAPSSGASKDWVSKVGALVRSKLPATIVDSVPPNAKAEFDVTLLPGGIVNTVKLVKSSGYPAYDEAARNAILQASPLPPPTGNMKEVPRNLHFPFTPKELQQ
ncbi:MAG TPA: cell envelope integrity protein TolA [Burkholderiales bacterium]